MTQKELAARLGVTPGYVSRLKKRGMPIDSAEAARAWAVKHSPQGFGHRSKSAVSSSVETTAQTESPDVDTLEAQVARTKEAERKCHAALIRASDSDEAGPLAAVQGLQRAHSAAAIAHFQALRRLETHRKEVGELMEVGDVRDLVVQLVSLVSRRLETMGRTIGAEANPVEPRVAVAAIDKATASLRNDAATELAAVAQRLGLEGFEDAAA